MLNKLIITIVLLILGFTTIILVGMGEEFAEKYLPLAGVGIVIIYLFSSWYLGYFIATQKPPLTLIYLGLAGIIISFFSGFFMGSKK